MRPSVLLALLGVPLAAAAGCGNEPDPEPPAGGEVLHLLAREPEARIHQPAAILPEGDLPGKGSWGASDGGGWARSLHELGGGQYLCSGAPAARLVLPATHPEERTLELALWRVQRALEDDPTPARVHVRLNGVDLTPDGLAVGDEPGLLEVHSPAPAWQRGENVLELAVDVRTLEGRRAWDVLGLASVRYGPAESVVLSTAERSARLAPRTGLRYALEQGGEAWLELAGTAEGAGELEVRCALMDPRTGEETPDSLEPARFALEHGSLAGRLALPWREGAVRMLELEWFPDGGAGATTELRLARVDVHEPQARPRPPIIFVSIDTFAARHLSLYGYERPTSPVLDELQHESIVFERCFSNAPWTLPSYLSVLSGLYPRAHDVSTERQANAEPDLFSGLYLAPNRWTLAEALRARGYRTGGFVDTYWLSPLYGLRQGFDVYDGHAALADFSDPHQGIELIVEHLVPPWLDGAAPDVPPFLFLHALDAHGPYLPEEPFKDTFFSHLGPERTLVPADSVNQTYRSVPHWMALTLSPHEDRPVPERMANEELVARYDETLLKVDTYLGKLFAELKRRDLWDQAVVVVTGDHGETFGPDVWGHGVIREDVLHVPLILKLPGGAHGGERVRRPVSLVDVYPTLLELAGLAPRRAWMHGASLLANVGTGTRTGEEPGLYCETGWVEQYTLTSGSWRLVEELPGSESADYSLLTHPRVPEDWLRKNFPEVLERPLSQELLDDLRARPGYQERIAELRALVPGPYHALYDLTIDPAGLHDVAAEHPEVVTRLLGRLQTERERSRQAREEARPGARLPELDDASRAALEGLGYGGK